MEMFCDRVREALPELELKKDEPMSRHTTFRIGGMADLYARPSVGELAPLLQIAAERKMPVSVIGNGSNLLVGDRGIRGLVIEIGSNMSAVSTELDAEGGCVTAEAGALLSRVANEAAEQSLGGMEFAAGIPGSIGGAVVMNAGAYGGEMKDILKYIRAVDFAGREYMLSLEELELGYRHSCIPERGLIVTEAVLALKPKPQEQIRAYMAELREKRVSKQPLEYPSAGSAFKRPQGYFAGKLIEDAGLRGYQVGGAQVSQKHCGFVVNVGGATAADVMQLFADVQTCVEKKFGVRLEPEVRRLGEF